MSTRIIASNVGLAGRLRRRLTPLTRITRVPRRAMTGQIDKVQGLCSGDFSSLRLQIGTFNCEWLCEPFGSAHRSSRRCAGRRVCDKIYGFGEC